MLAVALLFGSAWLVAAPASASQHNTLSSYEVLTASAGSTPQQVMQAPGWRKQQGTPYLSHNAPVWLRYQMPPANDDRVFVITNPWLLAFDVYLVSDGKVVAEYPTGNARPFANRGLATADFAFPVQPDVDYLYIYDHGISVANYPVTLENHDEFLERSSITGMMHGLYYGAILFMALYNLALFYGTRDKTHLFYTLYALSLALFLSTADGTGAMLFWPEMPNFQFVAIALPWTLGLVFLVEFACRYLGITGRWLTLHRAAQGATLVLGVLIATFANQTVYLLQTCFSLMVLALLVYDAILSAVRGSVTGHVFLVANGALALGSLLHALMLFGWLPTTLLLQHAIHIGSTLELTLFAGALVLRVRDSERARASAQEESRDLMARNRELRTARTLAEEHRQLQKSLQQAQKLKTIGQLAGGFAHDFNNILASILGFTELAMTPEAQRNKGKLTRYLEEVQRAGQRGASLVKQILLYSRSSHGSVQRLNLASALAQCHELVRGSLPATVDVITHSPESALHVHCDPEQLQQALVNLCLNAAEATNNRGRIEISAEHAEIHDLSCSSCLTRFSGEYVALRIIDNGPGIQGNANQLFTPFYTTKEVGSGTGLGLSVVHGICHEAGGHLHASNQAEGGARVVLYLPVAPLAIQPARAEAGTRRRILVIEDDPSVAVYLQSLLESEDFVPTIKALPTQALETFVADPDAFDLIITDHLMPQGTGLELAEDIHALRPDLPVILTTGNANNVSRQDLDSAFVQAVFQKPLNSEQLLAKIRGLLAG